MKFIHTSDWHLGKSLRDFSLIDDQRYILNQFIKLVENEKPDAILIAGDIFDRAFPPTEAVSLYDETMDTLINKLGQTVILISGNHDSPERLSVNSGILEKRNLFVVGELANPPRKIQFEKEGVKVSVVPIPYIETETYKYISGNQNITTQNDIFSDLSSRLISSKENGESVILMAHAFIAGGVTSESERFYSVAGATQVDHKLFGGFSYVALGHLHNPQSVGVENVRYSGSLLKYSLSEINSEKSVSVITVASGGRVEVKQFPLIPLRDVVEVRGEIIDGVFVEKQNKKNREVASQDFVSVVIENCEPVLNAMAAVKETYPNTVNLIWEKSNSSANMVRTFTAETVRNISTISLFEEFYKVTSGNEQLSERQSEIMRKIIEQVERGEQ